MILADKGFVLNAGRKIKFIMASVFHDPCRAESNEWVFRLPDDDNRNLSHLKGVQWSNEWLASLPIGVWCRIVAAEQLRANDQTRAV